MLADDVRVTLANVAHYDTGEGFGRRLPAVPLTTHPTQTPDQNQKKGGLPRLTTLLEGRSY